MIEPVSEDHADQPGFVVEYELTSAELREAARALQPSRGKFDVGRIRFAVLAVLAALLIYRLTHNTHPTGQAPVTTQSYPPWVMQVMPWVVFFLIILRLVLTFRSPGLSAIHATRPPGNTRVTTDDDGLRLHNAWTLSTNDGGFEIQPLESETRIPWADVRSFAQTRRLFLLTLPTAGALIVPRRSFATPAQADTFEAHLRKAEYHGDE